jgi:hypothetical protein
MITAAQAWLASQAAKQLFPASGWPHTNVRHPIGMRSGTIQDQDSGRIDEASRPIGGGSSVATMQGSAGELATVDGRP